MAEISSKVLNDLRDYDARVAGMREAFNREAPRPGDPAWIKSRLHHLVDVDQYTLNYTLKLRDAGYSPGEQADFAAEMSRRWDKLRRSDVGAIKELLAGRDWFRVSEFGAGADNDAWLIVQHADHDLALQKKILGVLEKLYPAGEIKPANYAYLYDRVAVAEGRPERFGTQGSVDATGTQWAPVEEPATFYARCAEMGVPAERYKKPPVPSGGWGWESGKIVNFGAPSGHGQTPPVFGRPAAKP